MVIAVDFNFYREKKMSSDIVIQQDILKRLSTLNLIKSKHSNHYLLTDNVVDPLYGDLVLNGLIKAGLKVKKLVIEAGEEVKSLETFCSLASQILSSGIDKHSVILSLGGGVINNIAGFIASTLYRGSTSTSIQLTL